MSALAFLSLQRVPLGRMGMPSVPTNEERIRAYRAFAPVQFANNHPWAHTEARRYELDAIADSAPDMTEEN